MLRYFDMTLNDKLHLLEGIAAVAAAIVAQLEMTIVLHIYQLSHEGAILVNIRMIALTTVEQREILAADILTQIAVHTLKDVVKQLLAVCLVAMNLPKRHRVGGRTHETLLVDIHSHTDDAVAYLLTLQSVLNQYASNLAITPIDIIGPFDAQVADMLAQRITDGQRDSHRDMELTTGRNVSWVNQHREQQVLAPLALPGIHATAATCRLVVGNYTKGTVPFV